MMKKSKLTMRASSATIPAETLLAMVDPAALAEIKKTDPNPTLRGFVVMHEGPGAPDISGLRGDAPINADAESLTGVLEAMPIGTQFTLGHTATGGPLHGEGQARPVIGRVVGRGLEVVDGRLAAVAVGYPSSPETRALFGRMRAASVEMAVGMIWKAKQLYIRAADTIASIALFGDQTEPGWEGALAVGDIRAQKKETNGDQAMDEPVYTLSGVKRWLAANLGPNKYELGDLVDTEHFVPRVEHAADGKVKVIGGSPIVRRLVEGFAETMGAKIAEVNTKLAELQTKAIAYEAEARASKLPGLLDEAAKALKISPQYLAYVKDRIDNFKPDETKDIVTQAREFIQGQGDKFKQFAAAIGIRETAITETTGDKTPPGGTAPVKQFGAPDLGGEGDEIDKYIEQSRKEEANAA